MAKLKWVKALRDMGSRWEWEAALPDGRVLSVWRGTGNTSSGFDWCATIGGGFLGEHPRVAGAKAIAQWYADSIELRGRK